MKPYGREHGKLVERAKVRGKAPKCGVWLVTEPRKKPARMKAKRDLRRAATPEKTE